MKSTRPRRYLPRSVLITLRPLIRYSPGRDAYVLRLVGNQMGPVMRPDRRRRTRLASFEGVERRGRRAQAA